MDNYIISGLQNFQKPDKNFIKDKECLICLESIDIEVCKIVKLHCNCNNSVYHINCIIEFLKSGPNKNFCPHCKKYYEILPKQVLRYDEEQLNNNIREIHLSYIYIFHIITNSFLNIINIAISKEKYHQKNIDNISKILLVLYFLKLFINCFIILQVKNDKTKIEKYLYYSYLFQTLIFILIIYFFYITLYDIYSLGLLFNNILFYFGDFIIRLNIQCKMQNRVNVII
jgi:hypothetical protein